MQEHIELDNDFIDLEPEKKYLRINDVAKRYSISRTTLQRLINDGYFPPPMRFYKMKVWPVEMIEAIDKLRNNRYLDKISDMGFNIKKVMQAR